MSRRKPPLVIDIVTLFPGMFDGPLRESIVGRAVTNGLIRLRIHNLRRWSDDPRHAKVDDRPFGGGAGMVIRAEPVYRALKALGGLRKGKLKPQVLFLSPQGTVVNQEWVEKTSQRRHLILLCGHYEGIDERLMEWVDEEVSIGDVVLTGGELPAMVVVDAVVRQVPGVVGDPESVQQESFSGGMLDYPHYTRPRVWRGRPVPEALVSGNHAEIERWRANAQRAATQKKRPDLWKAKKRFDGKFKRKRVPI